MKYEKLLMKDFSSFIISFSFFVSAFSFAACSDRPPVSEKKFVEVYVQLQLFEARYGSQPSVQKARVDSLLKAYNLSDSLVNSMLSWYSRKPERWNEFFDRVQKRMNEIKPSYTRQKH